MESPLSTMSEERSYVYGDGPEAKISLSLASYSFKHPFSDCLCQSTL